LGGGCSSGAAPAFFSGSSSGCFSLSLSAVAFVFLANSLSASLRSTYLYP